MSRKQRRQHYIDSHVQGQLIRRILLHWGAFFAVTLMCVTVMQLLLGDPTKPVVQRFLEPSREFILLGMILLALLPAFTLDTIRFSNRFVGPIARLRKGLRALGSDETVHPMTFRENDFWADAADEFNRVADRINQQTEEIERLKKKLADTTPVTTG